MKNFDKQKDYWKPCHPGTILKVSDSKFQRERRRFLIRSTMGAVVGSMGLFSAIFAFSQRSRRRLAALNEENSLSATPARNESNNSSTQSQFVSIQYSCADVHRRLDEYVATVTISEEDRTPEQDQLISGFQQHLEICNHCSNVVDRATRDA